MSTRPIPPHQIPPRVESFCQLRRFRLAENCDLGPFIKEIDPSFKNDLCDRAGLFYDTRLKRLPEAKQQTKNILIACLKTALLVSLIAATVLSSLFVGPVLGALCGTITFFVSTALYVKANDECIFPERRIQKGEPKGPWFSPNIETFAGQVAACTVIGGLVSPLIEACTRKARWENVAIEQRRQFAERAVHHCEFYKRHAETLFNKLDKKMQEAGPKDSSIKEIWMRARQCLNAQLEFLQYCDKDVPNPRPI